MARYTSGDFDRWHRLADERIIAATHGDDVETLDQAAEYAVKALQVSSNDLQRTVAVSQVRAAIDMRALLLAKHSEDTTENKRDLRQEKREQVLDEGARRRGGSPDA